MWSNRFWSAGSEKMTLEPKQAVDRMTSYIEIWSRCQIGQSSKIFFMAASLLRLQDKRPQDKRPHGQKATGQKATATQLRVYFLAHKYQLTRSLFFHGLHTHTHTTRVVIEHKRENRKQCCVSPAYGIAIDLLHTNYFDCSCHIEYILFTLILG